MIRNIISTTITRFLAALISLAIVILNSRNIGPEGVGMIGIIILDITIIANISGFFGGSSFVYFASKKSLKNLSILSLFSSIIGPILFYTLYILLQNFEQISNVVAPKEFVYHIIMISVLLLLYTNNLSMILGKEKIIIQNILTVVQSVSLILSLSYFFYFSHDYSVLAYVKSYYLSIIIPLVLSFIFLLRMIINDNKQEDFNFSYLKEIFDYGFKVQMASLLQIFNYRMSYYFLKAFFPNGNRLGIYTVGNQISEGLWIIGKSVAMVQYSRISNTEDDEINSKLTLSLLKFSVIVTGFLLLLLILLPVEFYVFIFHYQAFAEVKIVVLFLSPGIISLVANMIFSHYLSGIGRPSFNIISSFFGLVAICISGYFLIPQWGITGAAGSASITYFISMLISMFFYFSVSKSKISDLKLKRSDYILFYEVIKTIIGKKK
ncbi:MAG: hypothetical protein AUJ98_02715 [Bacteroidetes bacterium CG2_30_33_31]|nr:MAG: hypothetical protein AUJ98_02715 [Bacteroidetes bacterium CG2_30_33_31]